MASGQLLCKWLAIDGIPPSTNPAILVDRNAHKVLQFDQTTQEIIFFEDVWPDNYAGGGITAYITHSAVATTGTLGWDFAVERIGDGSQDLDSDGFATAQTITAVTVPGTSGLTDIVSVAIAHADIDGISAGEGFRIRIRRDVANDNTAGYGEISFVRIKET